MVAIAVVAILATLALPSVQAPLVRRQVVDSAPLINVAKGAVAVRWSNARALPDDNEAAGLPEAAKMVGSYVRSVTVDKGAIHVVFGNQASSVLAGRTLTFRPAVVEDAAVVPVAWVCGHAATPDKMSAKGINRTDVAAQFLPLNCRGG